MHQFDGISESGAQPWAPCDTRGHGVQCHNGYPGRMSCILSFKSMQNRRDRKAVPLISMAGGVVVNPQIRLKCAYGDDGSTYRTNDGCYGQWCNPRDPFRGSSAWGKPCGFGGSGQINAAWHGQDIGKMLELWNKHSQPYRSPQWYSGYNELVYDSFQNFGQTHQKFARAHSATCGPTLILGHLLPALQQVAGQTSWGTTETRNFALSSAQTYRHYRLYFPSSQIQQRGANCYVVVGEVQFFSPNSPVKSR